LWALVSHCGRASRSIVLVGVLRCVLLLVFYRRRLDGGAGDGHNFPVGICITAVLSCGVLFLLDVFHYYDRETQARRDRAFQKADDAAAEMRLSRHHRYHHQQQPLSQPPKLSQTNAALSSASSSGGGGNTAILDRKDMYGIFTSYSLLFICLVDLCLFELAWWQ